MQRAHRGPAEEVASRDTRPSVQRERRPAPLSPVVARQIAGDDRGAAIVSRSALSDVHRALGNRAFAQAIDAGHDALRGAPPSALPDDARSDMERAFEADFSAVRIHTDSPVAAELGALAHTRGDDIHFAPGHYNPRASRGRDLLGHELAHVVQQRQGRVAPTTPSGRVNDDPILEREADDAGARAARGDRVGRRLLEVGAGARAAAPSTAATAQLKKKELTPTTRGERAALERTLRFPSTTDPSTLRPAQALVHTSQGFKFPGMECNATAVMYMLQSYGLVPADMLLEEFERAFTPIDPDRAFYHLAPGASIADPERQVVEVDGEVQKDDEGKEIHGKDMFTPIFGSAAEANRRLRGGVGAPGAVPSDPASGAEILGRILAAFQKLAFTKTYRFMRTDPSSITKAPRATSALGTAPPKVMDLQTHVERGVPNAYFQAGHTIYAGINEHYTNTGITHYVLIVGYAGPLTVAGVKHHLYSIDDPFYGNAYVIAPRMDEGFFWEGQSAGHFTSRRTARKYVYRYKGHDVFPFAGLALGVEHASLR